MEKDKTICRCCLLEDVNIDSNDLLLNMENEAFIHQNQRVFFVDAFADLNNKPDDDRSAIYMSDVRICGSCAVLLESAYVLRKMCQNADRLTQNYCRCCQLENNDKNVHFLTLNTEVFEHNNNSIYFTDGFSAVNNYSVEDSDSFRTTNSSLCENCAVLLESAYGFQKMCRAATDMLHPKNSTLTNQPDCELNEEVSQYKGSPVEVVSTQPRTVVESVSEQRILRSRTKAFPKETKLEKTQPRKRKIDEKLHDESLQPDCKNRPPKVIISYRCRKCPTKLKSKIGLETHRQIIHRDVHSIRDLYLQVQSYSCQVCNKIYQTKDRFSLHTRRFHLEMGNQNQKGYRYDCKLCEKSYNSPKDLEYHNKSVHLNLRYHCEKCTKVYYTKTSFQSHYHSEHLNKPFACQDCSKIFKTLRNHIQKEHQIYACQDCDKVYKSAGTLTAHKLEVHVKWLLKCQYCSKEFRNKRCLYRHIKHNHTLIKHICEQCSKVYKNPYLLETHIRRVHQNITVTYACKDCDEKLSSLRCLKSHCEAVHLKTPFQCEKCPKKYSSAYQLKIHIDAVHLGKRFSCKICQQIFMSPHDLQQHVRIIHEKILYPCNQCSKSYKRSSSLYTHKQKRHRNKKWPCSSCAKVFETDTGLTLHTKNKHLNSIWPCKRCPATFKNDWTLRKHIKNEHNKCEYCAKTFRSLISLVKHKNSHPNVLHT